MTLADKVYAQVSDDGGALDHKPPTNWEELSQFEMDCIDFGLIYGIAWGIARGDDPYESASAVGRRASEAARQVWMRWNGRLLSREFAEVH